MPDKARDEGKRLHDEGCVTQIFGNHLFIQARVESDDVYRTVLKLRGNEWVGECSAEDDHARDSCLYATMLERMHRGENLPESPNEIGDKPLLEIIEGHINRNLTDAEALFVEKLQKRYRRYELEQEIYDHDLVRLSSKWEIAGYDPLKLWPVPPEDILDFWNYIAYAFKKKNLQYPEFMSVITDLQATEDKMAAWEWEREISEWHHSVDAYNVQPPAELNERVQFRLMLTSNEGRLQFREIGKSEWVVLNQKADLQRFLERHEEGSLLMDAASEILWSALVQNWNVTDDFRFRLDSEETCRMIHRFFHLDGLKDRLVTLDEEPFGIFEKPLRWICVDEDDSEDRLFMVLETAEGESVTHTMRVLPGREDLYLSDEGVFAGPKSWLIDQTEVMPRYELPREIVESESGVEFLGRVEAVLPASLKKRVQNEVMEVTLNMKLAPSKGAAHGENLLVTVEASDARSTRVEVLGKEGWAVSEQRKATRNRILRYNRNTLHRFPRWLEPMMLTYDGALESFKARVTRNFPERFAEWVKGLPKEVIVESDDALATLLSDPIKASVSFEVVEKEIDWFDLKVVVNVDGLDLTAEEIRSLVAARGGYVRMKKGGWLRLEIDMGAEQKEAVARLGLDPFDLTGETHRMHVLQLAEPLAKEVFDAEAWEKICRRAASIKLQVRPKVPAGLKVELRPYQVEGFHFLAYLSMNHFGGVLADDMGLGKTVQSLAWLLWLRQKAEDTTTPSLVVCPKSVLDVWAGEVDKFAPELRVQVLRNKAELNLELLGTEIDVLVVNYSQLRVCEEHLTSVKWMALILDEGQQIKNPDSKAAKVARLLDGENRLVLTGTPIENRLLDVWSLMAFAMPGVLGDRKYFREHFDRRKDTDSQIRLAARLRPFLVRRTKSEVAMDLPPRTEEDVLCKMEGVQEELYAAELQKIQDHLLNVNTPGELNRERFMILQGLMRLRQICCHPGLIDPAHLAAESAKMTALFYLLDQLREEGHKVLVFSQFVSMLNIIRGRLEEEDRRFNYLTGQTKDRQQVIEDFQTTKDPSVFLLSLKAGGSGLNLTAASYVVLYDPWWNPAVESQAIDRTHRIGQTSSVMAYRLLMRESVEEKIRMLQSQKKEMTVGVLGEEGFTRNLKVKDLRYIFDAGSDKSAQSKKDIAEGQLETIT